MAERKIVVDIDPSAGKWLTHEKQRTREFQLTPDWLIIGVPHEDHVTVYASSKLASATLTQVVSYFDELNRDRIEAGELLPEPVTLWARVLGIVIASGATYAEAMDALSGKWSPDDFGSTEERQRRISLKELTSAGVPSDLAELVVEDEDIVDAEVVEDEDEDEA